MTLFPIPVNFKLCIYMTILSVYSIEIIIYQISEIEVYEFVLDIT